ncbi:hypothetical protein Ahy_B07g086249 [Arachis hypogaea]|uniref:DNA-directed RNA polymerase III subunit RPC6 n=2 Tax=Arachis TaxID=3817 RepID=A0A444Y9B3_ARAHY|nr:hypothetical protein Ahy_B07g086249 [Arachis hypogaea]
MGPDWPVEPVRPGPGRSLPKAAHDKIGEKPLNRPMLDPIAFAAERSDPLPPFVAVREVFLRTVGSNPLLAVFFLARRPSSIEFVLLAVVLSPLPSSRRPLEGKTDGAFVHQTMNKWPSSNLGYSEWFDDQSGFQNLACLSRLTLTQKQQHQQLCSYITSPASRPGLVASGLCRRLLGLAGMSRLQGSSSSLKRKRELALVSDTLTDGERVLYNLILSKRDMGIWSGDMKRETNLPDNVVKKSLKLLQSKGLIKEVVNIQNKARKHYMAAQFEPSKEITGGDWYSEGNLDKELINAVKSVCLKYISRQKVVTCDGVLEWSRKSGVFTAEVSNQQIEEILRTLVLDDEIIEVKSTGYGDFENVPVGRVCYKCKSKGGVRGEPKDGAMSSIPCGVCPRINFCSPDGIVSPRTCVYYQKWLDF